MPTYKPGIPSVRTIVTKAESVDLYRLGTPGPSACCLTFTRSVGVERILAMAPKHKMKSFKNN